MAGEILKLRQDGNFSEACKIAKAKYLANISSAEAKRDYIWALAFMCKNLAKNGDADSFICTFLEIYKTGAFNTEDYLLNKSLAWYIRDLIRYRTKNTKEYNQYLGDALFMIVQKMHIKKPSLHYSMLLDGFLMLRKDWDKMGEFCKWWGFNNLQPGDFYTKDQVGNPIISLGEKAYVFYAKYLLDKKCDYKTRVLYRDRLNEIFTNYPANPYIGYYLGKYIILTSNIQGVASFLPLARKFENQFWVWHLIANNHKSNNEKRICSLIRAIKSDGAEFYKQPIRIKLAKELLATGDFVGARNLIREICEIYEKLKRKVPYMVNVWTTEPWFSNDYGKTKPKYFNYKRITQDILYPPTK